MKQTNILYYEYSSGFGGSGNSLYQLLNKIDKNKFNPLVVVFNRGPQITKIERLGIETIRLPFKKYEMGKGNSLFSYFELLADNLFYVFPVFLILLLIIKKYKINLLHVNCEIIAGIPAILAAKIAKVPIISHIRSTRRLVKREKWIAKFINTVIVLSERAKKLYAQDLPLAKIIVIYNGIDLDDANLFEPKPENLAKINRTYNLNNHKIVGLVGRIVQGKGHEDFLQAAKVTLENDKKLKFIIVGSGDSNLENCLKDVAVKLGINDNIVFTGWKTNVMEFIQLFDVLVQASSTFPEGFGRTCIEAMALSKPVIATDIPGPSEIVIDGQTGLIVPPANPEKMAQAIQTLLEDQKMRVDFGRAGRLRVEKVFDIVKIAKEVEDLYQEVLTNCVR